VQEARIQHEHGKPLLRASGERVERGVVAQVLTIT
jgi:hypothetical protein